MAQNALNFTKALLEALPPAPAGKRVDYHDSRMSGLILQVTDRSNKTFYLYRRINKKPKRYHLGRFPDLTLAEARRQAEALKGRIATGDNVMRERSAIEASAVTLAQAYTQFLAARKALKPKTR